jgi:large subunit ribosomal protein L5
MNFIFNQNLYNKLILLNNYKNIRQILSLEKIILHFGIKNAVYNNKQILSGCLALNILSEQKSILCYSSKSVMFLKVRQGMAVGCRVTLRKNLKFKFLNRLNIQILNLNKFKLLTKTSISLNTITIRIDDLFLFQDLSQFFENFDNLPFLNISFVSNSLNIDESFKFFNLIGLCKK